MTEEKIKVDALIQNPFGERRGEKYDIARCGE